MDKMDRYELLRLSARDAEWLLNVLDQPPRSPNAKLQRALNNVCGTDHWLAPFQRYWRCAHHLSAIENFSIHRTTCEWGCHTQGLRWHHGGVHPMPKSWGTPTADQILGV